MQEPYLFIHLYLSVALFTVLNHAFLVIRVLPREGGRERERQTDRQRGGRERRERQRELVNE